MSKIAAIIQKSEETSTDFYERLCEPFQLYTTFNPECQKTSECSIWPFWASYMPTFAGNFRNLKALLE
jgi:hypothetical protein